MIAMAAASTDTTTAISGEVVPRRRGKSKAPNFRYDGPVSVIRLELDVSDAVVRRRLERQWAAVFRLRRALQRDAAARCRAYWAARHERGRRSEGGCGSGWGCRAKGLRPRRKRHIEASGWMRDHLTKAVGLHVADEVWETVDRHLFADSSGRRHGATADRVVVGFHPDSGAGPLAHQSHAHLGDLAAGRHPGRAPGGLPAPAAAGGGEHRGRGRGPAGGHLDPGPARSAAGPGCGPRRVVVAITPARWRWCSPACRAGTWCCRCGCPRARASGRTCAISWPTRRCGTRSTWCGSGTAKHPAAGATTRIC